MKTTDVINYDRFPLELPWCSSTSFVKWITSNVSDNYVFLFDIEDRSFENKCKTYGIVIATYWWNELTLVVIFINYLYFWIWIKWWKSKKYTMKKAVSQRNFEIHNKSRELLFRK